MNNSVGNFQSREIVQYIIPLKTQELKRIPAAMSFIEPAVVDRTLEPKSTIISLDQTLAILDYMKERPQLAHSRFSRSKEGRNQLKRHWSIITDLANNISTDCAQRTPEQWRAYFNSLKSKLKKKIKFLKTQSVASGGSAKKLLTDVENRLYSILGPDLEEDLRKDCDTTVYHYDPEHQPSTSSAQVVEQDESGNSSGSESSDIVLYYPEDESGNIGYPVKHTFQLASVVRSEQQLKPVLSTDRHVKLDAQQQKPVIRPVQPLKPVVQSAAQGDLLIHSAQQPESLVHSGQRPGLVTHSGHRVVPVTHCNQRKEAVVNSGQHPDSEEFSNKQPEPTVHRDHLKRKTPVDSPPRLRRPSFEHNGGSIVLHEAMEGLLNLERMKSESKREATAAINRLAGAMEAIAKRLGEAFPRTRKRIARLHSSESD
ncbi:hypothetical protein PYW08_000204 [Mythimna loreyi]|uniref:Uncharacterized protein n=1 Tax=Mythimna loreyi TaxID=667449 RepID=A0ACC2RAM8_9NEOP|nr:hypothetical protein PYW08_000204 [Mythimna loreyi]